MSSPLDLLALPLQPMCAIRRAYRPQPLRAERVPPQVERFGVHSPRRISLAYAFERPASSTISETFTPG